MSRGVRRREGKGQGRARALLRHVNRGGGSDPLLLLLPRPHPKKAPTTHPPSGPSGASSSASSASAATRKPKGQEGGEVVRCVSVASDGSGMVATGSVDRTVSLLLQLNMACLSWVVEFFVWCLHEPVCSTLHPLLLFLHQVRVWDVPSGGELVVVLRHHAGWVNGVGWCPPSPVPPPPPSSSSSAAASHAGPLLTSVGNDGQLVVWGLDIGGPVQVPTNLLMLFCVDHCPFSHPPLALVAVVVM